MQAALVVVNPEDMDDDTFCLHMSKRHGDSLGGLASIKAVEVGTTEAWRNFHERLHKLRTDLTHEHGGYR